MVFLTSHQILASLEYITNRLYHFTAHATDLRALTAALAEISTLFTAALPPSTAPRPSPYKQAAAARARAKSSAAASVALSAASQQLLRKVDVSLTATAPHQALANASADRQARLLAHIESNQLAAINAVEEAVGGGAVEVQEMLATLFANSAFGSVGVTRREVEEGLRSVENGIGEVSKVMPEVKDRMEVAGVDGKGKRRERMFVGKWSGGDD